MIGVQSWVRSAIAVIVTLGFIVIVFQAMLGGMPEAHDGDRGLYLLLGAMSTSVGVVLQYYFQVGGKRE